MKNALIAFARAVGWGTLAGAAPYMALLFVPALTSFFARGEIAELLVVLVFPLMVSGPLVLGSAIVLGLPLTFVLSEKPQEKCGSYARAGALLGLLVPVAVTVMMGENLGGEVLFLSLPGALAGLVTGTIWGRWREVQRAARGEDL